MKNLAKLAAAMVGLFSLAMGQPGLIPLELEKSLGSSALLNSDSIRSEGMLALYS